MNITFLPLILAVAQPLLQSLFNTTVKNKLLADAKKAQFTAIHSIKGRRRYSSILLKDANFAAALKNKMESLGKFDSVNINSVTGTMLLTFSCDESDVDIVIAHLNEQSSKVSEANLSKYGSKAADFAKGTMYAASGYSAGKGAQSSGSLIGKSLKKYAKGANTYVKSSTLNVADLSIIVGAVCLIWGAYKVFSQKQTPNGPQLLWWGYKIIEGGTK